MHHSVLRCSSVVLALGLLAPLGPVLADPFFVTPVPMPWPDTRDVAVADFNGDGLADIAALDSYGPFIFECFPSPGPISCGNRMLLTVALNQGLGHFAPVLTTTSMCAPWTIVTGDFNADGREDVMIGNRGARDAFGICFSASISYYPGDGNGGFFTPQHVVVADEPVDMVAGDFDGDGRQEAAAAFGTPGRVQIFQVSLNNIFTSGAQWNAPASLAAIAAGDLDDDLDAEIVASMPSTERVAILDIGPGGAFVLDETCTLDPRGPGPRSMAIEDFTLDLVPDIAIGRPAGSGGTTSEVSLLRRGATGSYCSASNAVTTYVDGNYTGNMAAGDLNSDGLPDLATTDGVWHVRSLLGDGAGRFVASDPIATSGNSDAVVAGDLNGDWVADLVVGGPQILSSSGAVLVLLNDAPISDLMGLVVAGPDVDWNGVFDAVAYDIVRGDIGILRTSGGDFTQAVEACVANDVAATLTTLSADPPLGKAWWIVGRPVLPGGPGTYDEWGTSQVGSRDAEINASALACP